MATSIFLNGTSSSGKTSIARELGKLLPSYSYSSVDDYVENWANQSVENAQYLEEMANIFGKDNEEAIRKLKELSAITSSGNILYGYHTSIADGMERGMNYILDHILWWQPVIDDFASRLASYDIVLVGVHCPIEILKERETARGDRAVGIAEMQFPHVHKGKKYDIEVHTDKNNSYECASAIVNFIKAKDSSIWTLFSEKFY
ncbi:MAG: AAA family ATPase [Candidatus Nanoarchaeia archaeon]|jgi:chloramphenicol 3-O phosphotransferase